LELPAQTVAVPEIVPAAEGNGFTVIVAGVAVLAAAHGLLVATAL
jgi:hypothetical protein